MLPEKRENQDLTTRLEEGMPTVYCMSYVIFPGKDKRDILLEAMKELLDSITNINRAHLVLWSGIDYSSIDSQLAQIVDESTERKHSHSEDFTNISVDRYLAMYNYFINNKPDVRYREISDIELKTHPKTFYLEAKFNLAGSIDVEIKGSNIFSVEYRKKTQEEEHPYISGLRKTAAKHGLTFNDDTAVRGALNKIFGGGFGI